MKTNLSLKFYRCLLLLVVCTPPALIAQETSTMRGIVIADKTEEPLSGVTIVISGIPVGETDKDGKFNVQTRVTDEKVCFSALGFSRVCSDITDLLNQENRIVLQLAVQLMDEVVVESGYEQVVQKRTTGAYTVIDSSLFNRQIGPDVVSRLDGIASGVAFDKRGGAATAFSVRGLSTINSDRAPLIVVDNFPYDGDLNSLNPNDIARITVLKDAAATAIWGARAGNGVVVITTKRGSRDETSAVTAVASTTVVSEPDAFYEPQITPADFIEIERDLYARGAYDALLRNTRTWPVLSPVVELLEQLKQGGIDEETASQRINEYKTRDLRRDVERYLHRPGIRGQYSASLRGGNSRSSFLVSLGHDRNRSNLVGNSDSRITFRANHDLAISRRISLQTNVSFANRIADNNALGALRLNSTRRAYPYARLADEDGNPAILEQDYRLGYADSAGGGNLLDWHYVPLDDRNYTRQRTEGYDLQLLTGLVYRVLSGLDLKFQYQFARSATESEHLRSVESYEARNLINRYTQINSSGELDYAVPLGGLLDDSRGMRSSHSFRGQLDWKKQWGIRHDLEVMSIVEMRRSDNATRSVRYYGYDDEFMTHTVPDYVSRHPIYGGLASPSIIPDQSRLYGTADRFVSVLGNVRYIYGGRYILSANARRDASNLFGVSTNNKWKPLWSVGLAWNIAEEDFFKTKVFSLLKLRITHGYSGNVNNSVPAVTTMEYQGTSPLGRYPYAFVRNPPNGDLRWEQVQTTNMAVDFGLWAGRLQGSFDYYMKRATDLIASVPSDPTLGFSNLTRNAANLYTRGVDLTLSSQNLNGAVAWTTDLLFSVNKNTVKKYLFELSSVTSYVGNGMNILPREGYPVYSVVSYRFGGLTSDNGDPIGYVQQEESTNYQAINNNGVLDDLVFHGSAQPVYFGAIRNDFRWKRFSLSINTTFKFDYYFRRPTISYGGLVNGATGHTDYYLRWMKPGDELQTDVPSFQYPVDSRRDLFFANSTATVERGDHIRIHDLNVSYRFTTVGNQNRFFKGATLTIYMNNLNLFVWKATGTHLDPDFPSAEPRPRSVALGLIVNL